MTNYKLKIGNGKVVNSGTVSNVFLNYALTAKNNFMKIYYSNSVERLGPNIFEPANPSIGEVYLTTSTSLDGYIGKYVQIPSSGVWVKATSFRIANSSSETYAYIYGITFQEDFDEYTEDDIFKISSETATNLIGEELSIDTLTVEIRNKYSDLYSGTAFRTSDDEQIKLINNQSLFVDVTENWDRYLETLAYGTPVKIYRTINNSDQLIGEYFIKRVTRVSRDRYSLECISGIGILDSINDDGGFWKPSNKIKLTTELKNILNINEKHIFSRINDADDYQPFECWEMDSRIIESVPRIDEFHQLTDGIICKIKTPSSITTEIGVLGDRYDGMNFGMTIDTSWHLIVYYGSHTQTVATLGPNQDHELGFKYFIDSEENPHHKIYLDGSIILGLEDIDPPTTGYLPNTIFMPIGGTYVPKSAEEPWIITPKLLDLGRVYWFMHYRNGLLIGEYRPTGKFASSNNCSSRAYNILTGETLNYDISSLILINRIKRNYPFDFDIGRTVTEKNKIDALQISGWLPSDTKRQNLYKLMFAYNLNIIKDANGKNIFTWINTDDVENISDENIYIDGGSITYPELVENVEVTEHTYSIDSSNDTLNTLYETNSPVADSKIEFSNAPIDLSTLVLEDSIIAYNITPNNAIVSGEGTILGLSYNDYTAIVNKKAKVNYKSKTASVNDNGLINATNSEAVLSKIFNYYSKGITVKNSIIYSNQKTGFSYNLTNPYGEKIYAFLTKMSMNASSLIKSTCEFVTGYSPTGFGGIFTSAYEITGTTGTFDFSTIGNPSLVKVVLISGGDGGEDGDDGESGGIGIVNDSKPDGAGVGGDGGLGGYGGSGGRVYSYTIENPTGSATYSIGSGGLHYSGDMPVSAYGSPTTFTYSGTTKSSSSGAIKEYINPFTEYVYGGYGYSGMYGGNGGSSGESKSSIISDHYDTSYSGESITYDDIEYEGMQVMSAGASADIWVNNNGNGGGAAVGADLGLQFSPAGYTTEVSGMIVVTSGNGGAGGNAINRTESVNYGQGGHGGHGGGGGGAGGELYIVDSSQAYASGTPQGGAGGTGGDGTNGGSGIIIILY